MQMQVQMQPSQGNQMQVQVQIPNLHFANASAFEHMPDHSACLKSQVGLLQTAHYWANAGVLLGAHVRRRVAFEKLTIGMKLVREEK